MQSAFPYMHTREMQKFGGSEMHNARDNGILGKRTLQQPQIQDRSQHHHFHQDVPPRPVKCPPLDMFPSPADHSPRNQNDQITSPLKYESNWECTPPYLRVPESHRTEPCSYPRDCIPQDQTLAEKENVSLQFRPTSGHLVDAAALQSPAEVQSPYHPSFDTNVGQSETVADLQSRLTNQSHVIGCGLVTPEEYTDESAPKPRADPSHECNITQLPPSNPPRLLSSQPCYSNDSLQTIGSHSQEIAEDVNAMGGKRSSSQTTIPVDMLNLQ